MRYYRWLVQSLHSFAPAVLAEIIRRQPASKEKTSFAWSMAVGPALARATTVELRDRTLRVSARDQRWAREVERAHHTILARLQHLLGRDAVEGISIHA